LALRRKWLPHEHDDSESLGMAMWLEKRDQQATEVAVTQAICKAFSGK